MDMIFSSAKQRDSMGKNLYENEINSTSEDGRRARLFMKGVTGNKKYGERNFKKNLREGNAISKKEFMKDWKKASQDRTAKLKKTWKKTVEKRKAARRKIKNPKDRKQIKVPTWKQFRNQHRMKDKGDLGAGFTSPR